MTAKCPPADRRGQRALRPGERTAKCVPLANAFGCLLGGTEIPHGCVLFVFFYKGWGGMGTPWLLLGELPLSQQLLPPEEPGVGCHGGTGFLTHLARGQRAGPNNPPPFLLSRGFPVSSGSLPVGSQTCQDPQSSSTGLDGIRGQGTEGWRFPAGTWATLPTPPQCVAGVWV